MALALVTSVTSYIRSSSLRRGSGTVSRLLSAGRSQLTPSRWRSRLFYIATLMYLTLNGSDNCTAIAPRFCNGLPMLRRGLEVVGLIITIIGDLIANISGREHDYHRSENGFGNYSHSPMRLHL